jgi:hypothetical protein
MSSRKSKSLNGNYCEKHHIIPKSLGGSDDFENLVLLTAREHYIAHLLLIKMTTGEDKMKMSFALRCMSNFKNKYHRRYVPSSKIYEIEKKYAVQATSLKNTGHPNYLKKHSEESKEKIKKTQKERFSNMSSEEKRQWVLNSMNSADSWTEERKNKISKSTTGKKKTKTELFYQSKEKTRKQRTDQLRECAKQNKGKTWKLIDGKRVWMEK